MPPALLLRPEIEQQAYALNCRFTVTAPDGGIKSETWLSSATKEMQWAGKKFIAAMEKEGWTYLGLGLEMTGGPFPHVDPRRGLPSRIPDKPKRRPGQPSVSVKDPADYGYYIQKMDPIRATEKWDYELTGLFTKAVLTEYLEVKSA